MSANFLELPALRIVIPFIIGIGLQRYLNLDLLNYPLYLFILFFAIALFTYGLSPRAWTQSLFLILLISFGFLRADLKENYHRPDHFEPGEQTVIGIVQENIVERKKYRTSVKVEHIVINDSPNSSTGNLLCYFEKDENSQKIKPGDRLLINGTVLETSTNHNPLAFDFKNYLHNRGINHQIFIQSDDWEILSESELNYLQTLANNLRNKLLTVLRKHILKSDEQAIAAALTLGYRNQLTSEIYDAYTDTGSVHVLAVSGLHLGILTKLILVILGLFKSNHRVAKITKATVTILAIWLFALVTGAAPAVIRAATMFTLYTIGVTFSRNSNTYNILALSALILLLYDPFLLFQASFQFSYLALTSILYFHPIISAWWIPENKFIRYLWNLAVVAIAAQILVFPVTVYYFHKFPLYFILSGIVAVPSAAIILSLGLGLFLVEFVAPTLNQVLGPILETYLEFFLWTIMSIQKLPMCSVENILIRSSDMILIYILLVALMIGISFKKPRMIFLMLSALLFYAVSNCFFLFKNLNQKELIVYDHRGATSMDIITGLNLYEVSSIEMLKSTLEFANENYRLSKKIKSVYKVNPFETRSNNQVISGKGYLAFEDLRFLILNNKSELPSQEKIKIDYLIIGKVSTDKLVFALELIEAENIILTNANPFWETDSYLDILKDLPHHYIGRDGAYITSL